jgi:hypothetical protein
VLPVPIYWFVLVGEDFEYQRHEIVRKAQRTWDTLGLLLSLLTNQVILKHTMSERNVEPGSSFATLGLSLLQALQFGTAVWYVGWYRRARLRVHSTQRVLRLVFTLMVYWQGASRPSEAIRYKTYSSLAATYLDDGRSLAVVLLVEPMLGICHALYQHLPWTYHLAYVLCRVPIDAFFVVPTLGLLINSRADMQEAAQRVCPYVCRLLTAGTLGSTSLITDVCRPGSSSYFLPAAAMLVIGTLLPLLVTYWFELTMKLQYLRDRFPDRYMCTQIDGLRLGALLLLQMQMGMLLCFCAAQLLAVLHA